MLLHTYSTHCEARIKLDSAGISHDISYTNVTCYWTLSGLLNQIERVPYMDTLSLSLSFSDSHMPSAKFTHLILCRDSNTVLP